MRLFQRKCKVAMSTCIENAGLGKPPHFSEKNALAQQDPDRDPNVSSSIDREESADKEEFNGRKRDDSPRLMYPKSKPPTRPPPRLSIHKGRFPPPTISTAGEIASKMERKLAAEAPGLPRDASRDVREQVRQQVCAAICMMKENGVDSNFLSGRRNGG